MPSRKAFARVFATLLWCASFFVAALAPAQRPKKTSDAPREQPRISIQLNTPDGTLPDYLCVVGGAGIATVSLDRAFRPQDGSRFSPLSVSREAPPEATRAEQESIAELTQALLKTRAPSRPANTHFPHEDEIAAARTALGKSVKEPEPSCGRSLCDARIETPYVAVSPPRDDSPRIACRREGSAHEPLGERPRVVVIALQFYVDGDTQPQITNLEYDKKGVIDLDAFLPRYLVTAKVVGGHYTVGSYAQSEVDAQGHHRVSLALTPLCTWREVALSDLSSTEGEVKVRLDITGTPEGSECRGAGGAALQLTSVNAQVQPERTVPVLLPVGLAGEKQLRIESPDPKSPSFFRALVAWSALEPPRVLSPRFEAVSFRWRRHCSFPSEAGNDCPIAVLPEVGITCRPPTISEQSVCAYSCERVASGARNFSLPTVVQLSSEGRAWDAQLLRPNMLLTTYLSREEEFVRVRFPGWNAADVRSARTVDIELPSGERRTLWTRVEGAGSEVIEIAGACSTAVRYQLTGDRSYSEASVKVRNGVLSIPRPSESARLGRLRLRVGYAQSFQVDNPTDWEGQKSRSWPEFRAELGVNLRPNNWVVSFEPHVGLLATWREYYEIRRDATAKHPSNSVAYLNFVAGGAMYVHPLPDVAIGASFQLHWGTPMHSDVRALVGAVDLAVGPGLSFVYQSWRTVAIWADVYYLAREQVRAFETDFRGQPQTLESSRSTLALGGGLTFGIY